MSIITFLNQIKNREIVLPAIQRDFVWEEEKIETLLDSIMRGYPTGIVLLWETYANIQYRTFVENFRLGELHTFADNNQEQRIRLVLDGQQRLQSLYTALYGSYDGKFLYFNALSGNAIDDLSEQKFVFRFFPYPTASKKNEAARRLAEDPLYNAEKEWWIRVSDLFTLGAQDKRGLRRQLARALVLSQEDEDRLEINLSVFDESLTRDDNILKVSIIDENLPNESPARKTEADVLEIFVRINTAGTPLSRSDLIFSMLKLNWRESAEALPEFLLSINEGNSFEISSDFIIRCLLAVSDLGTKLNLDLLRKQSNVRKLRENFQGCCESIRAAVDFIRHECWCESSQLLGGVNTLIPLVYYLFHAKNHEIPNNQVVNARKAMYLLGFARPFSRYADSRPGAFIRDAMKSLISQEDEAFPFDEVVEWVSYWERYNSYDESLIQNHYVLALHLVQRRTGGKVKYTRNSPEIDHIFPRSVLREKGYDESMVNHFGNFWILARGKNQNKSNRSPASYFRDVDDSELKRALIDRRLLDYGSYRKFLKTRSEQILAVVTREVGLSREDFTILDDDG